jgi:hypothetical protein
MSSGAAALGTLLIYIAAAASVLLAAVRHLDLRGHPGAAAKAGAGTITTVPCTGNFSFPGTTEIVAAVRPRSAAGQRVTDLAGHR